MPADLAVAAKDPARASAIGLKALQAGRGILPSGSYFRLLKVLLSSDEKSGIAPSISDFGIELMAASRCRQAKFPESEPPLSGLYFVMMGRYSSLNPAELPSVFREAATALDLYVSKPPSQGAVDESLDPVGLPAGLLHLYGLDAEQLAIR